MLAISRNPQEIVKIGDEIEVMVISVQGRRVMLGIKAPAKYRISRDGGKSDIRKSEVSNLTPATRTG